MSGPNLALGISAPGVSQVQALAQAVDQLDSGLRRLAQNGATASLNGLNSLEAQMRKLRAELKVGMQGLRTDLVDLKTTLANSISSVGKAAKAGAAEAAKAVEEAEKTTTSSLSRYTAQMMVGAQNYEQARLKAAVKETDADKKYLYRMMVGSAQYEEARLKSTAQEADADKKFTYRMMVGAAQIEAARQVQVAKEADDATKFKYRLMTGSAKYEEARLQAAAKEADADKKFTYRLMAGSAQIAEAQAKAAQQEEAANIRWVYGMNRSLSQFLAARQKTTQQVETGFDKYTASLMVGSAKIAEAQEKAAEREEFGTRQWMFRANQGITRLLEQRREENARLLESAEKKAATIDLASRTVEAAYQRASARAQVRISMAARSQLDQGIGADTVGQRFGASALGAAQGTTMAALREEYDRLGHATRKLGEEKEKVAPKIKGMGDQMHYAHSAARGLASGFGALWLTWGSLVPLLAGAAISHSFVSVIKLGAEVQHTFEQIHSLAGASSAEVHALSGQMLELARLGPFGPAEIAKAMKTLSLAGLEAKDVYSSVRDVLNFATAGDTTIEKAADVMTTVATAFNVSAQNYSYVGDTVAKAAAESKSSVESMGEAFKTASVINQQYGVSLEDTAIGLSLLANAGIQGTAAGTALRNMYVDLGGRTPKVTKALKELGVETLDVNGKMRAQADIFKDLMEKLSKYTPKAQYKAIQDVFSERGGKEAVAIMNALRKTADETGESVEKVYHKLYNSIMDSAGFTAIAAARISQTAQNQLKTVMSTLRATFVETFNDLQPMVLDFAHDLRTAFASEEFKNTLTQVMVLLGQTTLFAVDHAKEIMTVVAAYVGVRGLAGALTTAGQALLAFRTAAAAGAGAMSVATAGAGLLVPGLNVLVGIVTAGAAAWAAWQLWAGKSSEKMKEMGTNNAKDLLERLTEEADRLWKVNEARRQGISLMELEARVKATALRNGETKEVAAARNALEDYDAKSRSTMKHMAGPDGKIVTDRAEYIARTNSPERERLVVALEAAQTDARQLAQQTEQQAAKIRQYQEEAAKSERERIKNTKPYDPSGTLEWDLGNGRGNGRGGAKGPFPVDTTEMATVQAQMNERLSVLKDGFAKEVAASADRYRAEESSAGEFFARSLEAVRAQSAATLQEVRASTKQFDDAYSRRLEALGKQFTGEALESRVAKVNLEYDRFTVHVNETLTKAENDTRDKMSGIVSTFERETAKLVKSDARYWAKAEQRVQKDLAASQARREYADATDEVRAAMEASAKVEASHSAQLEKLNSELEIALKALSDFRTAYDDRDLGGPEGLAAVALEARVSALSEALKEANTTIDRLKGVASADAINDVRNKATEALSKDIRHTLAKGLVDAAEDGGKALRDTLQEALLKKPLTLFIEAMMQPMIGSFAQQVLGASGGGGIGGFATDLAKTILGGSTPKITPSMPSGIGATDLIYSNIAHTGGKIGSDRLSGRAVDPSVFSYAPRFHTGGIVGDEVPIIAKRGEGVFTPAQMSAMGGKTSVVINNYTGEKSSVKESTDSRGNLRLEVTLGEMTAAEIRRPGSAPYQAMRENFGVAPALVPRG